MYSFSFCQKHHLKFGEVPQLIQNLYGKAFVFKIKVSYFNLKGRLQDYSILQMFTPISSIENEFRLRHLQKAIKHHYFPFFPFVFNFFLNSQLHQIVELKCVFSFFQLYLRRRSNKKRMTLVGIVSICKVRSPLPLLR